jgi:hypothetical protein
MVGEAVRMPRDARPAECGRQSSDARVTHGIRARFAITLLAALAVVGSAARDARADLTATYDGSLTLKTTGEISVLAGSLVQAGNGLSGSVAVNMADPSASGVYFVAGTVKAKGKRIALLGGNQFGTQLRYKGKVSGDTVNGKVKLQGAAGKVKGSLSLYRRVVLPPVTPPITCDNPFFTGQVMGLVLQPVCGSCHIEGGAAASAAFRVNSGDALATMASVALQIDKANPSESRILQKPLGLIPHSGGIQLLAGSEQHNVLQQWVNLVATDQHCDVQPEAPLVPMAASDLLVRASMDVRGKRPSIAELDAVDADANAYAGIVDQYLNSPDFIERVKDVYDDALLLRREDFSDESRDETAALYGEAIELIAHIVANNRPFTEIGTADYTVANDLFQRDTQRMPFPMEPVASGAFLPTHYLDGRPHAGVLSTSAFYEVWDTNDTNKNRRRANRWSILFHCYNFLDTPVDVTRDVDNADGDAVLNAVTTRPDCKACHDRLDPLASFLFPLDRADGLEDGLAEGGVPQMDFFSGDPERWRTANRRPPSVYGVAGMDIRDLGRLLTAHPKFAECQTKRAFRMLFQRDPKTSTELNTAADIAGRWPTEDNYNYRSLVRRWMMSDAYRGMPQDNNPDWIRRASPERMESLIGDLTGFVWTREPDDDQDDMNPESDPPRFAPVPLLTTEEDGFKIILGGINGVTVSGRSSSLNASVINVQRKVAALAADHVLQSDLLLPDAQRVLLAGVTGVENPVDDEAVLRGHIVRLMRRLYGRRVTPDSPQVDVWYQLYSSLYGDETQAGTGFGTVPGDAGERAWRGTLTAMLRSPKIVLY